MPLGFSIQACSIRQRICSISGMGNKLVMSVLLLVLFSALGWLIHERNKPQPVHQGKAIAQWIRDLAADDYQVRGAAAEAVQAIGPEAVPYLIDALRQHELKFAKEIFQWMRRIPFVRHEPVNASLLREQAAEQLGALSTKSHLVVPALVAALQDSEPEVTASVQRALRRIGTPAVPQLAQALSRRNARIRQGAAEILRDFGLRARAAVPALREALADNKPIVRRRAAEALGACGEDEPATSQQLRKCLRDPVPSVRCAAADALGFLRAMTASGDLTAALGDKDTAVRIGAARALWHIRREAEPLLPVLTTALHDAKAGWQAIFLLGEIGPEAAAAIPSLIVALKQEKVPRPLRTPPSSAIALGKVGIAAVPELLECLRDAQPRVRASAAIALGFVGPKAKAAVPALAELLTDHAPEVRQAAALSLGEIDLHTKELPAVLVALTRDDDIFVSASAASLLQRIDPEMPIVSRE